MYLMVVALFLCIPGVLWESARSRAWLRRDTAQLAMKEGLEVETIVERLLPEPTPKLVRIVQDSHRQARLLAQGAPFEEIARACRIPVAQVEQDASYWETERSPNLSKEIQRRMTREVIGGTLLLWGTLLVFGFLMWRFLA